jgi:3-isopropylmalate/(R)-2-methylmalate dehydratase small subunit
MSAPRSEGYGRFLLHDLRVRRRLAPPAFPLNARAGATILVAGATSAAAPRARRRSMRWSIRLPRGARPELRRHLRGQRVNNGLLPGVIDEATERSRRLAGRGQVASTSRP